MMQRHREVFGTEPGTAPVVFQGEANRHFIEELTLAVTGDTGYYHSILFVLGQGFAPNLMVLGVSRFLAFITVGGLEPVFLNMLSNVSPEEKRGQIFGMASSFRSIGMMIASPLGGAIMYYLEIRSIYITAAAGFLLTIPVFLLTSKLCRKAHNEMIQKTSAI